MKTHFDKKSLNQLRHLDHDSASMIIAKMPNKLLMKVFATECNNDQIAQLFAEYRMYAEDERMAKQQGEPKEVMNRYRKKLKAMCKALNKARRGHLIPKDILKGYG